VKTTKSTLGWNQFPFGFGMRQFHVVAIGFLVRLCNAIEDMMIWVE
jgi:hypothetical protein